MIWNSGPRSSALGLSLGPLYSRIIIIALILLGIIAFARYNAVLPLAHIPTRLPSLTSAARRGNLLDNVLNETLGFEKIFVVNLPSRTDRRDAMSLAASYTGLGIEYVEGVTDVSQKVLPPLGVELNLGPGGLGCWRAHLNIFQNMVEKNIQSALILEDDADWDVHVKFLMQTFAKATQLLVQPLLGTNDTFIDPSYPLPAEDAQPVNIPIDTFAQHPIEPATTSPYGDLDRWDLLWVGHCGRYLPYARNRNVPLARITISDDETVPEPTKFEAETSDHTLVSEYPPLTRLVSRAWGETCTSAYAVSLPGAKRLLYELGVWQMTGAYDMQLRSFCQGHEGRETAGVCLSPFPQYFNHHISAGSMSSLSDISDPAERPGYVEKPFTQNIRWSTRVNFPRFVQGRTDWIDSFAG